jgi:N-acetylglutamate synthase-like GNAT family acetyltransferase
MWVAPENIGTGVGKELFIHAMQSAAKQNVSEVGIVSDPNAEGFYRKMGAHQIGDVFSESPDEAGNPRMLPRLKVDLDFPG